MQFASATTLEPNIEGASHALVDQVGRQGVDADVDVAFLFLSSHYGNAAFYAADFVRASLAPRVLVGCTSAGVIGQQKEIEDQPAAVLIVARLPGVEVKSFALHPAGLDDVLRDPDLFLKAVAAPTHTRLFVTLADPYSMRMDRALSLLNTFHAEVPVVGGMCGAPRTQNVLLLNDRILTGGAVGVAFAGDLEVDAVVSQGCRPVGPLFTITEARENLILGLNGLPALLPIRELMSQFSSQDRASLRHGLFLGRSLQREQDPSGRGGFLILGLMGADVQSGAIAVADVVQEGETVQFHLRDAETATEDLELTLSPQAWFGSPSGALLFSCNGRGTHLYGRQDGDISTVQQFLGGAPLAGLFCAGEIGPIGGLNFVHGQTASLAVFRPSNQERTG
jgi:small ligand-binding sensory domain FIST